MLLPILFKASLTLKQLKIEVPPPLEEPELDSGATTPWDERAPRFAHECPEPPTGSSFFFIQLPLIASLNQYLMVIKTIYC